MNNADFDWIEDLGDDTRNRLAKLSAEAAEKECFSMARSFRGQHEEFMKHLDMLLKHLQDVRLLYVEITESGSQLEATARQSKEQSA